MTVSQYSNSDMYYQPDTAAAGFLDPRQLSYPWNYTEAKLPSYVSPPIRTRQLPMLSASPSYQQQRQSSWSSGDLEGSCAPSTPLIAYSTQRRASVPMIRSQRHRVGPLTFEEIDAELGHWSSSSLPANHEQWSRPSSTASEDWVGSMAEVPFTSPPVESKPYSFLPSLTRTKQNQTQKSCSHCHTTTTPLWRRDPNTMKPLCNACGLYLQQRNKLRPQELIDADLDSPPPEDQDPTGPQCSHCETRNTSVWRRGKNGEQLCNACGVYLRLRGMPRPLRLKRNRIRPRSKHSVVSGK